MITSYRRARQLAGLTVEQLAKVARRRGNQGSLTAAAIRKIEADPKKASPWQRAKFMHACINHGVVFVSVDNGRSVTWFRPVKADTLATLDSLKARVSPGSPSTRTRKVSM